MYSFLDASLSHHAPQFTPLNLVKIFMPKLKDHASKSCMVFILSTYSFTRKSYNMMCNFLWSSNENKNVIPQPWIDAHLQNFFKSHLFSRQIKREFGSFDKYLWAFVNHKPIATQYKSCLKIPVKTSKSESISKDMVRRGFRLVGPTVIHSFMEAAGLTNDHLINCPRHLQCVALASQTISP